MNDITNYLDKVLSSITTSVKCKTLWPYNFDGSDCVSVKQLAAANTCSELKAALYAVNELSGRVRADAVEYVKSLHPSPHASGNGVMLCMVPDWNSRQQIAMHSGDDPGQIHCTLYYAGKTSGEEQVTGAQIERLHEVGHLLAASCDGPIEAKLNGIARFSGEEPDGDPIVVCVDSPKLPPLYMDMMKLLVNKDNFAFRYPTHGYTPHITIGYEDVDGSMPIRRWDTRTIKFTNVELWVAGSITSWPMGTEQEFIENMYADTYDGEPEDTPEKAIPQMGNLLKDVFNGEGPGGMPHRGGKRKRVHHPELVERIHQLQKPRETK